MGSVGYGFKKPWASEIHHGKFMKFEILADTRRLNRSVPERCGTSFIYICLDTGTGFQGFAASYTPLYDRNSSEKATG